MQQVMFKDREHQEFYLRALSNLPKADSYHRALFYTLGLNPDIRANFDRVYDFSDDAIKVDCIEEGWQTNGSLRVTRLAFNLWNGWNSDGYATPYDLFDCEYAPYMMEAVKLRYPEYCRDFFAPQKDAR